MSRTTIPPFSARDRGAHSQIDNDFPESARTALLHLLYKLVEGDCVSGWPEVARDLERIARLMPAVYGLSTGESKRAREAAEEILFKLPWQKVFDFCERLHSHLAQDVWHWNHDGSERIVTMSRAEVQARVAEEVQLLFLEEAMAFEFSEGIARRRGRHHTAEQVSRAETVLGDPRLSAARAHFNKALRYFRDVKQPDPENVVKEVVCAVEATGRALFPSSAGSTLDDLVKSITGSEPGQLPKPLAKTFLGLYGYRGGAEGVSHGGASGGPVTRELSEYVLAVSASQIVLLVDLAASQEGGVPF